MCLILLDWDNHPKFRLIVAANRDEFHDRASSPADWWRDHSDILGGRDLEANGTWMAINRIGQFGAVTNVRKTAGSSITSRGHIATDFLLSEAAVENYLAELHGRLNDFDGYNFVGFDGEHLAWFNNVEGQGKVLERGIYAVSNASLDTEWPKVSRIKSTYQHLSEDQQSVADTLFDLLADNLPGQDEALPDTGIGIAMERQLSPIFIEGTSYGTRCSTLFLLGRDGNVQFFERRFDRTKRMLGQQSFEFAIEQSAQ